MGVRVCTENSRKVKKYTRGHKTYTHRDIGNARALPKKGSDANETASQRNTVSVRIPREKRPTTTTTPLFFIKTNGRRGQKRDTGKKRQKGNTVGVTLTAAPSQQRGKKGKKGE